MRSELLSNVQYLEFSACRQAAEAFPRWNSLPDSHVLQGPRGADFDCPQRIIIASPEGKRTGNARPYFTGQRLWTREGTQGRTPAGPAFIVLPHQALSGAQAAL